MPIGLVLLAAFIGVPLLEIWLFIEIGGAIGVLATIAIVVVTAIAGASLVRAQGLRTFAEAQAEVDAGRVPVGALGEAAALLFSGALLLTPGFFTDAIGFALLVPPLRKAIVRTVGAWLSSRATIVVNEAQAQHRAPPGDGPIIDGEAEEVKPGNSGWTRPTDGRNRLPD